MSNQSIELFGYLTECAISDPMEILAPIPQKDPLLILIDEVRALRDEVRELSTKIDLVNLHIDPNKFFKNIITIPKIKE